MSLVERSPSVNVSNQGTVSDGGKWGTRVGSPLEEVRSRLLAIAARLEPQLDEHAQPLVAESRRVLQEQACRIAVIGQIKAGKSSFVNAFTHRPELLPTDINPWTSVVTILQFRNDRPPPEHAAVFQLFSRDEWQRLAEGGGRLRELTERLVPGFEPELLRAQLEVMRQRAERRIGPQLQELLGQTHRYKKITPELLDDYVSAGTYLENGPAPGRLLYSDITRTAELHFSGGPFAYPVTVIDTPGTNDPFLVRDEITRRSLEKSDIYVFVISALQPLAASDVSLLRILNGLHKDRIVVFVNRVDQLPNPLAEAKAVRANVKSRLEREFPALDIPVIVGSAWWGGLSLVSENRDVPRVLPASSVAYLREYGLPASIEVGPTHSLSVEQRSRLAAALYASSGIPAVAASITELLSGGTSAVLLRQLTACFLELARSTEVSAKLELQSLMGLRESRRAESRALGERLRQERESLSTIDEPIQKIQHSFGLIERQLSEIVRNDTERLKADLISAVEGFADAECQAMLSSMRNRDHDGHWRCDLTPLREGMELHYVDSFRYTESQIIEIERVLYPQLRTIIEAILPGYEVEVSDDYSAHPNPYPSVTPLTDTVVLDLDVPWWKLWFAARPEPRERAADLKRLIRTDFLPVVDEMVREAQAQFAARITRMLQQAHAVSTGMLSTFQRRKAQVLAEHEAYSKLDHTQDQEEFERNQQLNVDRCAARQAAAATLADELAKLLSFCQSVLTPEGRNA
jgi:signal recognition particle receptor subunit beta